MEMLEISNKFVEHEQHVVHTTKVSTIPAVRRLYIGNKKLHNRQPTACIVL